MIQIKGEMHIKQREGGLKERARSTSQEEKTWEKNLPHQPLSQRKESKKRETLSKATAKSTTLFKNR